MKEKKKMGRPTDNPKTIRLEIRLTPDEAEMLEDCANKLHTTKTAVIVQGIHLVKNKL